MEFIAPVFKSGSGLLSAPGRLIPDSGTRTTRSGKERRRDVEYEFFTAARRGKKGVSGNGTHYGNREMVQ